MRHGRVTCDPMLIPDLSERGVTEARKRRILPESTVSRVLESRAERALHNRSITLRGPTPYTHRRQRADGRYKEH